MTLLDCLPRDRRLLALADEMKGAGREQDADDLLWTVIDLQRRRAEAARANATESRRLLAMLVCVVGAIAVAVVCLLLTVRFQ